MPLTTIDDNVALVAIDLQKSVASLPTERPVSEVVSKTLELARAFRKRGLPVVLVRVEGGPGGRTERSRTSGQDRPVDWADLVDDLEADPSDHVVTKKARSAFSGTDLDAYLRDRGVTQVVLTGVSTTSGVESTARAAYDHGYHVVLVTDAITDTEADAHEFAVSRVFPRLGETTLTLALLEKLDDSHPV